MQLVRPDTLPFIAGFIIIFLFIIGVIGLSMIYFGAKSIVNKRNIASSIIIISIGICPLTYSLMNYFGYQKIFNEMEIQIIGVFSNRQTNDKIIINSDYTWSYNGNRLPCNYGVWIFQMSEDCNYWNINAFNKNGRLVCYDQTFSPNIIQFAEQDISFYKE